MLHNVSLLHMYREGLGMTIFENYYKVHKNLAKNTCGLYPLLVRNKQPFFGHVLPFRIVHIDLSQMGICELRSS